MATNRNLTRGGYTGKTAQAAGKKAASGGGKQTFLGSSATSWSEFLFGTSKSRAQLGKDLLAYSGMRGAASPISAGRNVIDTARALRAATTAGKSAKTVAGGAKTAKAAKTVKATKATPAQQYPNLPRTGRRTATGKSYTTAEMRKVAAASGGNYKVAGTAAVVGGAIAIGAANRRSGGSTQQKYSGMKPGAEKVRTGPGRSYVGSGMGVKPRPSSGGGSYVGSTVGGNTGGRKPPSQPSSGGSTGSSRTTNKNKGAGGGQSRRTKMVAERLRLAEDAARSGNVAAAANYARAAANIQKKGQGPAKSMKRVQRVARTYRRAAGGSTKPAAES